MRRCLENTLPDGSLDAAAVRRCIRQAQRLSRIELVVMLISFALAVMIVVLIPLFGIGG